MVRMKVIEVLPSLSSKFKLDDDSVGGSVRIPRRRSSAFRRQASSRLPSTTWHDHHIEPPQPPTRRERRHDHLVRGDSDRDQCGWVRVFGGTNDSRGTLVYLTLTTTVRDICRDLVLTEEASIWVQVGLRVHFVYLLLFPIYFLI